jgi:4-nitrophenyl phosphatase
MLNFNYLQAVVTDMDGVLLRGPDPLPGLAELFDFLYRRRLPFIIATNNSTQTPAYYRQKLTRVGATGIQEENILTSAQVTAAYLRQNFEPGAAVYVIGQPSLSAAIEAAGFAILTDAHRPAAVVVVGGDPGLTYAKLKDATLHLQHGASLIGTNPDLLYPTEEGLVPEAGTILAAIQTATGVRPLIMGKPERFLFEQALARLGSPPAQTVMLGDRLDTDILGGQRAGLKTVLLTTGVDDEAAIAAKGIRPDAIFEGLIGLVEAWSRAR